MTNTTTTTEQVLANMRDLLHPAEYVTIDDLCSFMNLNPDEELSRFAKWLEQNPEGSGQRHYEFHPNVHIHITEGEVWLRLAGNEWAMANRFALDEDIEG